MCPTVETFLRAAIAGYYLKAGDPNASLTTNPPATMSDALLVVLPKGEFDLATPTSCGDGQLPNTMRCRGRGSSTHQGADRFYVTVTVFWGVLAPEPPVGAQVPDAAAHVIPPKETVLKW